MSSVDQRVPACSLRILYASSKGFSDPFLYIEREGHIIDTTMCHHQGYYYRVSVSATVFDKNENVVETVGRYSGEVYY